MTISFKQLYSKTCTFLVKKQVASQLLQHIGQFPMKAVKQFILECDFFAHGSLQRYKEEESYRTTAGGIVSIILFLMFVIMFSNLVIQTFRKSIIVSQTSVSYDDDPTYSEIITSSDNNFMFAIGISNMDLGSSQRYFDIVMTTRTHTKVGTKTSKTSQIIELQPCDISEWTGFSGNIENSFYTLNFTQWLCPSTNQSIPLQGKFTSNVFKFAQISINPCTNNPLFPNTTCHSDADLATFLQTYSQFTFNYYFINPVINPSDKDFVTYYLEDSNYFAFDTTLGANANLYYSEYTIQTDTTFLPWQEYSEVKGARATETALGQNYQITNSNNSYFKFNLRKAAHKIQISRSFQKIDQTFSYIGGLFGFLTLLLSFLRLYSKYSYELDLGDKIFKQEHGGSFGIENFNFVVFLGYLLFNLFTKFAVILNWKTMKKYHKCRMECQKQLNIDLLFKKINHFEEITKIVLQDFQLKMLLMAPKPTIKEAKLNRKRYLIKNVIYHNLQQRASDINVEKSQLRNRLKSFLREQGHGNQQITEEDVKQQQSLKVIQEDIIQSYRKIKNDAGDSINSSRKIIERINIQDMAEAIFSLFKTELEHKIENVMDMEQTHEHLQTKTIEMIPLPHSILEVSQFSEQQKPKKQPLIANVYQLEQFQEKL